MATALTLDSIPGAAVLNPARRFLPVYRMGGGSRPLCQYNQDLMSEEEVGPIIEALQSSVNRHDTATWHIARVGLKFGFWEYVPEGRRARFPGFKAQWASTPQELVLKIIGEFARLNSLS